MAKETIFMTGFPGFLCRQLVHRLADRRRDARFVFLIEEKLRTRAQSALDHQNELTPGFDQRSSLVPGDITELNLGLSADDLKLARSATEVWHFAAIYNLAIGLNVAYRVNVLGTSNVLDFCQTCPDLAKHVYISTCYVAGDRTGRVLESELDCGQGFKNHYESTKCWAEMEVRRRIDRVPSIVLRPSIVLGDSRTGDTDKYDGPYYLITGLLKLPSWIPIPFVGRGDARVNLVPVDFEIEAMAAIAASPKAVGMTFHVADPNPYSSREIMAEMVRLTGHRTVPLNLPAALVDGVSSVKQIEALLQIPRETIIYFNHEAMFDTTNTDQFLEGTDVVCPDLMSYLPILVDYVRQNPHKTFLDGRRY